MNTLELLAGAQVLRAMIFTSVDGAPALEQDVRARIEQQVMLHAVVAIKTPRGCTLLTTAPAVDTRCRVAAPPEGTRVRWLKVEADRAAYDNVPQGEFHAAEIGWIESEWAEGWSLAADVRPVVRRGIDAPAGAMRFRALIELPDGRTVDTPTLSRSAGGPPRAQDLRKVLLRVDDGYLGLMSELAGLPYIFGSTELGREPHQADRAIGVDCADLVIYGLRRLGHDLKYRSSRTLSPISRKLASAAARKNGVYVDANGEAIPIGVDGLRPGDWIVFGGHVGAFFRDRGVLGRFDEQDLMMHIAWKELAVESMIDSGYGVTPFELRRAVALDE